MSKSITKLLVSFGTAICFTSFLGTTITRSQPVPSESCSSLSKSKEALTIEKAVEDTAKPEPCERSKNLTSITKENPRLIWNDDGHVLMVTWKGDCDSEKKSISCKKIGEIYPVKEEKSLWVTAVPELKEFVLIQDYLVKQNKTGSNLSSGISYRLKQYLGLKPNSNYTNFVEIWVNPKDLIRPCLSSKVQVNDPQCTNDPPHPDKNGYPFTGLGYTYDWGNSNTDIGASEFIVRKDAIVTIHDIKSTSEYLQGLTPNLQQK
jgi:hypothetical protein